jgi:hypothetical protein
MFAQISILEYHFPTGCFVASPAALPRILRNAPVSQPPAFNRSFSFTNYQAQNPTGTLPGSQVDLELNNAKTTLDGVLTNLKQIQRDDGALKNGSVTFDTLSAALQTAGLAPALPWVTGTPYAASVSVTHGSAFYRCIVPHTSGTFATDLANGQWILIVDFSTIALVAANQIAVTPSGTLTTDVQTSLQALDTGKAPLSHTHLSAAISDSTAAGRAMLTAADVPTQQNLLGFTVLGFQPGNIKETAGIVLEPGWYWCDGSNKNRVTDAALFNAITIQQTGTLNNTAVVSGLADTSNISPGMPVSAAAGGVPANTVIQSVDSSTQITMSANATATAVTPLVFAPYGVGDGSTTFGLPLLRRGRPRQRQRQRFQRDAGLDVDQHHQWQRDRDCGVGDRSVRRNARVASEGAVRDYAFRHFRHDDHVVGECDRDRFGIRRALLADGRRADVGPEGRRDIAFDDAYAGAIANRHHGDHGLSGYGHYGRIKHSGRQRPDFRRPRHLVWYAVLSLQRIRRANLDRRDIVIDRFGRHDDIEQHRGCPVHRQDGAANDRDEFHD